MQLSDRRQLHLFIQEQAPEFYTRIRKERDFELAVYNAWEWIKAQRLLAAIEAMKTDTCQGNAPKVLAERAAQESTVISLSLIWSECRESQQETRHLLA